MKKQLMRTVEFCDACNKEELYTHECMECGRAFCYDCSEEYGVRYPHAVSFSGSGDGFYCVACDEELRKIPDRSKVTQRHQAYLKIGSLRSERNNMYEQLEIREKEAEAELQRLLKELLK